MASPPDETTEPQSLEPAPIAADESAVMPIEAEPEMPLDPASDRLLVAALYAAPMLGVILLFPKWQGFWMGYTLALSGQVALWTTLGRRSNFARIIIVAAVFLVLIAGHVLGPLGYLLDWLTDNLSMTWPMLFFMLVFRWKGLEIGQGEFLRPEFPWWRFSLQTLFYWIIVAALFLALGVSSLGRNAWYWITMDTTYTIKSFVGNMAVFYAAGWLILGIGKLAKRMFWFFVVVSIVLFFELLYVLPEEYSGFIPEWFQAILFLLKGPLSIYPFDGGILFAVSRILGMAFWHLAGFAILRRRGFRMFWRRRPI